MASHPKFALYEDDDQTQSTRGGKQWRRPKMQFWAIYEKTGSFAAALHALGYRGTDGRSDRWDDDGLCHWPNDNRPAMSIMRAWANDYDNGDAEIDPKIKQAILKRYENQYDFQIKEAAKETIIANKESVLLFNKQIAEGSFKSDMTPALQHVNNGVQNTVRALKESLMPAPAETKKAGRTKLRQAKKPPNVSNIDRTA